MVKYCDGLLCKRKKRKVKVWRYLNGVSNTKVAPLVNPNNVAITNTPKQPIDPMIAAFGGSEKYITKNPDNQVWNAVTGIGSELLNYLPFLAPIKLGAAGLRAARGISKIRWTKAPQTWAQAFSDLEHLGGSVKTRYDALKGFGRLPSTRNYKTTGQEMFKFNSHGRPVNEKYFNALSSVGKQRVRYTDKLSFPAVQTSPNTKFVSGRYSKLPNRSDSATARKARFNAANPEGTYYVSAPGYSPSIKSQYQMAKNALFSNKGKNPL